MSDIVEKEKRVKIAICINIVLVIVAGLGIPFGLMGGELGVNQGLCGFLLAMGLIATIGAVVVGFWQEKGVVEKNTYITAGICVLVAILIGVAVGAGACSGGSGGSGKVCQFKSNGQRVCSNEATHGDLCDYHFRLLDDTYNDLLEGWD